MLTDKLGRFIADIEVSSLPARITQMTKERLLDLLGVALAGYRMGHYRPVLEALNVGVGNSTIYGKGSFFSARDAAIVNSFMAHSTYLEDGSRSTGGHPSSAVIPAVLSLGETLGISGNQLILGIVSGYEVFIRIGAAIYPSTVARGFQPTAILASMGAAGGCAKILEMSKEGCSHSIAIAANLGSGLKSALREPHSQPIQVGRSCEGGLLASMVANRGLKGYPKILESFIEAHAEASHGEDILKGLGEKFAIEETYIKVHGGCRGNHAPVDVVLKLVHEKKLPSNRIEKVRIGIDSVTASAEIHPPKNGEEAQFSIPFSVACALCDGNVSLFQFTDERVKDPVICAFMDRIEIVVEPDLDKLLPMKRAATAEIVMKDGSRYRDSLDFARGEPECPLGFEEIETKFKLLAGEVLGDKAHQVVELIADLDHLKTVNELTYLLKSV
jgi:2-methylcitrate dehydratase PrpD